MQQNRLVEVFDETLRASDELPFPESLRFNYSQLDRSPAGSRGEGTITVENVDCIEAARTLSEDYSVCLLNMASDHNPGGGVKNGRKAQEEELCRRSNLYVTLKHMKYPLDEFEGIYSVNVTFFRQGESGRYKKYKKNFKCDVVSVAAYRMHGDPMYENDKEGTRKKIRMMLSSAKLSGCNALVLSAFGCGAYGGDPEEVAPLFKEVLMVEGWASRFERIVFAIIEDDNSQGKNYDTFRKHLS
jgi:uncharacterized protein (TIGR02452 family)